MSRANSKSHLYLLYVLFGIWWLTPGYLNVGPAIVRPVDLYIVFFAYVALMRLFMHRKFYIPKSKTLMLLLALILWGYTSVLWASNKMNVIVDAIQWIEMLVVFLLICNSVTDWDDLRKFTVFLVLLATVAAILRLTGLGVFMYQKGGYAYTRFSAYTSSIGLMAANGFVLHHRRRRKKFHLAMVICGLAVIFSLERHAWVGLLLAIPSLILLRYSLTVQAMKRALGIVGVLLLVIIVSARVAPTFVDFFIDKLYRLNVLMNIRKGERSDIRRLNLEKAAIAMGLDHPWTGVGLKNHGVLKDRYMPPGNYAASLGAHDSFTLMFAELGFPGLIIWFLLVLQPIKLLKYYKRVKLSPNEAGLVLGLVGVWIYTLSELALGSFDFNIMMLVILNLSFLEIIRKFILKGFAEANRSARNHIITSPKIR